MSAIRYYARAYEPDGSRLVEWAGIAPGGAEAEALARTAIRSARATLGLPSGEPRISMSPTPHGSLGSIWAMHEIHVTSDVREPGARPAAIKIDKVRRLLRAALAYGSPAHARTSPDRPVIVWNADWGSQGAGPMIRVTYHGELAEALAVRPGTMAAIAHACLRCEPPEPGAHGYRDDVGPERQQRTATHSLPPVPGSATARAALAPESRLATQKATATLVRFLESDGQRDLAETIRREAAKGDYP